LTLASDGVDASEEWTLDGTRVDLADSCATLIDAATRLPLPSPPMQQTDVSPDRVQATGVLTRLSSCTSAVSEGSGGAAGTEESSPARVGEGDREETVARNSKGGTPPSKHLVCDTPGCGRSYMTDRGLNRHSRYPPPIVHSTGAAQLSTPPTRCLTLL
jgi:hypothetical protein